MGLETVHQNVSDDCCGGGACENEVKSKAPATPKEVCKSGKGEDCCGDNSCVSEKQMKEKTEGLLEDESIEEIHREPAKPVSKKWKILDEDGLRNRGGGGGCCSSGGGCGPKTYKDETDEDRKDTQRRTWLSRFLLLMLLIPAIPMILVGWEIFMSSQLAMNIGLASTPRQRLEAFYSENNPSKLNEYNIQKLLRKWEGRYDQLFKVLEVKYSEKQAERRSNTRRNKRSKSG